MCVGRQGMDLGIGMGAMSEIVRGLKVLMVSGGVVTGGGKMGLHARVTLGFRGMCRGRDRHGLLLGADNGVGLGAAARTRKARNIPKRGTDFAAAQQSRSCRIAPMWGSSSLPINFAGLADDKAG